MNTLAVVLLAAGGSVRYGGPKLLATLDGVPLVRRAALAVKDTGASLLVVTGAYTKEVRIALEGLDARFVDNPNWAEGMGSSIAAAFRHLIDAQPALEAVIVCPADLPLVGAPQLMRLITAHRAAPGRIVASQFGTALGPPCLFPKQWFPQLACLSGAQGARALLDQHREELVRVAMPEAAFDVDTPMDFTRLETLLRQ